MKSALERLKSLVPPPATPFAAGPVKMRNKIERSLGASLPDDLFSLALTYGNGAFGVPAFSEIVEVFNPFSPKYFTTLSEFHDLYRDHKQNEGNEYIPFDIFPSRPGLLAWGCGENRRAMFWLTEGIPSKWPTILLTPEHTFQRFTASMTSFLVELFSAEIDSFGGSFGAEWFRENRTALRFSGLKR